MHRGNRRLGLQQGICLLWAIILILGMALQTISYRVTLAETEAFSIEQTFLGQPFNGKLVGRIYLPKAVAAPYPTMILCHGVASTKETVAIWAEALAQQGSAAIIFDFQGSGESVVGQKEGNFSQRNIDNLNTLLAFVRSQPQKFDSSRLGVGGHSMGGAVALAVANEDPAIAATVLLGMMGDATPSRPHNLFVGLGLFEELNPVPTVQAMLQAASDQDIQPFETIGNFQEGTARRLFVSPAADHLIEPYDFSLIQAAVDWSKQSFGVQSPPKTVIAPLKIGISFGVWFVSLGLSVAAFLVLIDRTALAKHQRLLPLGAIASSLLVYLFGISQLIPASSAANLLLWLYFINIVSTYLLNVSQSPWVILKVMGLYGVSIYGISFAALGLNHLSALRQPGVIAGFLQLFFQLPIILIYNNSFLSLRSLFFPSYNLNLSMAIYLPLLLALELWRPGITLKFGQTIAEYIIHKIRQPLVFQGIGRSPLLIGISLLGVGSLGTMMYEYWQSGLLASLEVNLLLSLIFSFMLLPSALTVILIRSPLFRRWESRCLQPPV